jgi:cold shock CspA family protein
MPEGEILSYDAEEQTGFIEPDDEGDPVPFSLDAVEDYHAGERLSCGQIVVYQIDDVDEVATSVRRVTPGGYG